MTQTRPNWLQRQLEIRLLLPVLLIVIVTGLLGAYGAHRLVGGVFDRWLMDAAKSVAKQVHFSGEVASIELSAQSQAMLTYDAVDSVYFEVVQDGSRLVGEAGLPVDGVRASPQGEGAQAYDAQFGGKPVRIARVAVGGPNGRQAIVLVAETLIKRQRAERDLLLMMLPLGALPVLAALAIAVAVRSTIRPLERIAERWNERSHESLQPLPADDLPKELLPFAQALNGLLARLGSMLERERRLAATAAHQLRTPLAGLQLGLTRAAEASDLEGARSVLREMVRTTERTARLVQQLLALGRLDPELRTHLQFEHADLVQLAREVGESYLDAALKRNIELAFASDVPSVPVRANADLLTEALANVMDNAIRYTQEGGQVTIRAGHDAAGAFVHISDSGPGIPLHERPQIFERFVRGQAAIGDGSGLGLSIVMEIASLHGAEVTLDDASEGGTRLTIRFSDGRLKQGAAIQEAPLRPGKGGADSEARAA